MPTHAPSKCPSDQRPSSVPPWLVLMLVSGVLIGVMWYGATGETGVMGWLNNWQQQRFGSYSRSLSFLAMSMGGVIAGAAVWGLGLLLLEAPKPTVPPADAASTPELAEPARSPAAAAAPARRSFWRQTLRVWIIGAALCWGSMLAIATWDYTSRTRDAEDAYTPAVLTRGTLVPGAGKGSRYALQGRLLWDRSATRQARNSSTAETVFVPIVNADWQAGEPVRFVVQLGRAQAVALSRAPADATPGTAAEPLLVRVTGQPPTPAVPVFSRAQAPLADDAWLLEPVASQRGQVADVRPAFNWEVPGRIGSGMAGVWTFAVCLGALMFRPRAAGKPAPAAADAS